MLSRVLYYHPSGFVVLRVVLLADSDRYVSNPEGHVATDIVYVHVCCILSIQAEIYT